MVKHHVDIDGISETMLWTLHNRASEAARADGCIHDPVCLQIYQALEYDYTRHFGKPDGSHGVRSQMFDDQIRAFLRQHPDGVIVNLGEGLETQRYRVAGEQALWLSVDVPQAIDVRERFIQADEQHRHIRASALDPCWFADVPQERPVMITAQGLFMYFTEQQMGTLIQALAQRFPGALLMFDYLNTYLSKRSMSAGGWMKTPHYRTPPMPWGIKRADLPATLAGWVGQPVTIHNVTFLFPRGWMRYVLPLCEKIAPIRNMMPGVCYLYLPKEPAHG